MYLKKVLYALSFSTLISSGTYAASTSIAVMNHWILHDDAQITIQAPSGWEISGPNPIAYNQQLFISSSDYPSSSVFKLTVKDPGSSADGDQCLMHIDYLSTGMNVYTTDCTGDTINAAYNNDFSAIMLSAMG
ncbi:hypothetical protein BN59_01111 [Legionella massiliensis]|uniref:Uncharacterized protein n=1 Tax=Legionella massiliensis TaxID=1034943 RepID=A0A078KQZ3_9GAMM|nr:hypothetical protein [Legionella massiliensis]CDZ76835.1 hypothetical protein BN59_01111 [Legionella massiliensis]CEE12573.1 hypothetical protein BN1094_01111 [Legionella massiliensis]